MWRYANSVTSPFLPLCSSLAAGDSAAPQPRRADGSRAVHCGYERWISGAALLRTLACALPTLVRGKETRTLTCSPPVPNAAIVGPYDRQLGSLQSSLTWFCVEHAPGQLPAEGQPPSSVGCVAKAIHTQQLVEDGGRSVAEIAAMPACTLPQLARRYAARPAAADMGGVWRDGCTHLHKLVASLQVGAKRQLAAASSCGRWSMVTAPNVLQRAHLPKRLASCCAEPPACGALGPRPAAGPRLALARCVSARAGA